MKINKRQFRIGSLAKEVGVQRFVIRFWEKEFDLDCSRSSGGQRFYEQKDLETFKLIKTLLHEQGFTIAGAKKVLQESKTTIDSLLIRPATNSTTYPENDTAPSLSSDLSEKLRIVHEKLVKLRELL